MTKSEDIKLLWECTLGGKSHMNIFGKILLFPLIFLVNIVISLFIILFEKSR